MTTRIDVELDDQEVRQRLAVLMRSVTDTLPVMRGIAAELLAETEFAFMDEGRAGRSSAPRPSPLARLRGVVPTRSSRSQTPWLARSRPGRIATRRESGPTWSMRPSTNLVATPAGVTRSKFLHGGICRSTKTANWRPAFGSPFWTSSSPRYRDSARNAPHAPKRG